MNLEKARVVLRPRSTSDITDLAIAWQRQIGGRLFIRLSLWLLLPSIAACMTARLAFELDWDDVWVMAVFSTIALEGVFTVACGQLLFSDSVTAGAAWRQFGSRLGVYIGVMAIMVITQGLLLITVIGWLLAWPSFIFWREAVLLENLSPRAAVRRSHRFVMRERGRAFGFGLLLLMIALTLVGIAELLGGALLEFVLQVGRPFGTLEDGGSLSAIIGLHASVPLIATARFLAYIDQRTRQDGWDIQVRFLAIANKTSSMTAGMQPLGIGAKPMSYKRARRPRPAAAHGVATRDVATVESIEAVDE